MSKPRVTPEHLIYYRGKRNIYACSACKHKFVTIDLVEGTTPFMLRCLHCKDSSAQSSCYKVPQDLLPTHEWYKPDEAEYAKLDSDPNTKEHVDMGGLLVRPVPEETLKALRAAGILTEKLPKVMVAHVDPNSPKGRVRVKQEFI